MVSGWDEPGSTTTAVRKLGSTSARSLAFATLIALSALPLSGPAFGQGAGQQSPMASGWAGWEDEGRVKMLADPEHMVCEPTPEDVQAWRDARGRAPPRGGLTARIRRA